MRKKIKIKKVIKPSMTENRKIKIMGKELEVQQVPPCSLRTPRYRKAFYKWKERDFKWAYEEMIESGGYLSMTMENPIFINSNPKRENFVVGPYYHFITTKSCEKACGKYWVSVARVNIPNVETEKEFGQILDRRLSNKATSEDLSKMKIILKKFAR